MQISNIIEQTQTNYLESILPEEILTKIFEYTQQDASSGASPMAIFRQVCLKFNHNEYVKKIMMNAMIEKFKLELIKIVEDKELYTFNKWHVGYNESREEKLNQLLEGMNFSNYYFSITELHSDLALILEEVKEELQTYALEEQKKKNNELKPQLRKNWVLRVINDMFINDYHSLIKLINNFHDAVLGDIKNKFIAIVIYCKFENKNKNLSKFLLTDRKSTETYKFILDLYSLELPYANILNKYNKIYSQNENSCSINIDDSLHYAIIKAIKDNNHEIIKFLSAELFYGEYNKHSEEEKSLIHNFFSIESLQDDINKNKISFIESKLDFFLCLKKVYLPKRSVYGLQTVEAMNLINNIGKKELLEKIVNVNIGINNYNYYFDTNIIIDIFKDEKYISLFKTL